MRHALHWHLLGSAGLALLLGLLHSAPPAKTFVIFVLIVVAWGCVANVRDARLRWQRQRNPFLLLGLLWNLGLAVLVLGLYRGGWGLGASLLVLLGYSVVPWGMGRLGLWGVKRWRDETNGQ